MKEYQSEHSNKNMDKLFQKVSEMESRPALDSWSKIDDQLSIDRKRKQMHTLRYAAAIALVFASAFAVFRFVQPDTAELANQPLASNSEITEESTSISPVQSTPVEASPDVAVIQENETMQVKKDTPAEINIDKSPIAVVNVVSIQKLQPDMQPSISYMNLEFSHRPIFDLPVYEERNSRIKRAFEFVSKVKNGEEKLLDFDLVEARKGLFTRGNSVGTTETTDLQ